MTGAPQARGAGPVMWVVAVALAGVLWLLLWAGDPDDLPAGGGVAGIGVTLVALAVGGERWTNAAALPVARLSPTAAVVLGVGSLLAGFMVTGVVATGGGASATLAVAVLGPALLGGLAWVLGFLGAAWRHRGSGAQG